MRVPPTPEFTLIFLQNLFHSIFKTVMPAYLPNASTASCMFIFWTRHRSHGIRCFSKSQIEMVLVVTVEPTVYKTGGDGA
jgi:hypothetical protein